MSPVNRRNGGDAARGACAAENNVKRNDLLNRRGAGCGEYEIGAVPRTGCAAVQRSEQDEQGFRQHDGRYEKGGRVQQKVDDLEFIPGMGMVRMVRRTRRVRMSVGDVGISDRVGVNEKNPVPVVAEEQGQQQDSDGLSPGLSHGRQR